MKMKVFISYRNQDTSRMAGQLIRQRLINSEIDVFFDVDDLKDAGGTNWVDTLRRNVTDSDVVIVLLDNDTGNSNWVQREIDTAIALRVNVLPLVIGKNHDEITAAVDRLHLGDLQYMTIDPSLDQDMQRVIEQVFELGTKTRDAQKQWLKIWRTRHYSGFDPKQQDQAVRFRLPGHEIAFDIATGDATEIRGYDVLVNTENNYMQMARYYETNTLSSAIRHKGAHMKAGRMIRDSVQEQLYDQIIHSPEHLVLPVADMQVIPTYAGHPESDLVATGFRYIFHAATVEIDRLKRVVQSLPAEAIPEIVRNCVRLFAQVQEAKGAILYDQDGNLEDAHDSFQALDSLLFPVFGTGEGGNSLGEAVVQIARGLRRSAPEFEEAGATKIGLCVYSHYDLQTVRKAFAAEGFVV